MVKFDKLLCTPSAVLRCYLLSRFPEIDISGNEKGNLVRLQPWIVNGAKKKTNISGHTILTIDKTYFLLFYAFLPPCFITEWQPFRPPIQGRPRELVLCWGFLSPLSENAHTFTFHWITLIAILLKSQARKDQEYFHFSSSDHYHSLLFERHRQICFEPSFEENKATNLQFITDTFISGNAIESFFI